MLTHICACRYCLDGEINRREIVRMHEKSFNCRGLGEKGEELVEGKNCWSMAVIEE